MARAEAVVVEEAGQAPELATVAVAVAVEQVAAQVQEMPLTKVKVLV